MSEILKIGDTFSTYRALHKAVVQFGNANRVQYWKRDTRRLRRAPPKIHEIAKSFPELEYYSIKFACIHGGQRFRPKVVPKQRKSKGTSKQDCKAEILVGLNEDRNRLIIKKIIDEHNHDIPSEAAFKQIPKSGKNTLTEGEIVRAVQPQPVLDNIVRTSSVARSKNFHRLATVLAERYECAVDLQYDDHGRVVGFFFQDCEMKKQFAAFPEILLIDGTYKLHNINCCIYVLSIENSVGHSIIVAVGVLTVEDKNSSNWMLEKFIEHNRRCENVAIVVTDRLTSQYKIVENHFPNARRLICITHALQAFKKDTLRTKTPNVPPTESEQFNAYFVKMMGAENEEDYRTILEEMEDSLSYTLMDYFLKSWHDLRSEWVRGFTATVRSCVNSKFTYTKLKSTIANCRSFSKFIDSFFVILNRKRNEFRREYSRMCTRNKIFVESSLKNYSKYLTTYATDKIKVALTRLTSETNKIILNPDADALCQSEDGTFVVSEFSCNCDFFTLLRLPCVHLLSYRHRAGSSLFDVYLFSERWTKKYLVDLYGEIGETADKFEEAQSVCATLAELCCEDGDRFEARIEVLEKLRELWQDGEGAVIGKAQKVANVDHDYTREAGGQCCQL